MTITVYSKPDCVQCTYTKKKLDEKHLAYTELDISQDEAARKVVEDSGNRQMPMVVVKRRGRKDDVWHGFKLDNIRGLSKDS